MSTLWMRMAVQGFIDGKVLNREGLEWQEVIVK
jgi:hypothetical protein